MAEESPYAQIICARYLLRYQGGLSDELNLKLLIYNLLCGRTVMKNETLAKPIIFYDVFAWCGALIKTTLAKKLKPVQRAFLIGASDALLTGIRTTLNAILHIAPVDKAGRCIVAKVVTRLKDTAFTWCAQEITK